MEALESDDDILTVTELSKWLQIHPDIIQQLAGKNNPKMQIPSLRRGDRLLFRRGDVKQWRNRAWEYDYYDLRGTRTTIKGKA